MTLHHQAMPLRQQLVRSVAEECGGPQAVRFDPSAMSYEAFSLSTGIERTKLLGPMEATSLVEALGEATSRWAWDRGDRLGIREIGTYHDLLYVYAVRRKAQGIRRDFTSVLQHARWLDHVATINLNVIAGIPIGLIGGERDLHERRQAQRPDGAAL